MLYYFMLAKELIERGNCIGCTAKPSYSDYSPKGQRKLLIAFHNDRCFTQYKTK